MDRSIVMEVYWQSFFSVTCHVIALTCFMTNISWMLCDNSAGWHQQIENKVLIMRILGPIKYVSSERIIPYCDTFLIQCCLTVIKNFLYKDNWPACKQSTEPMLISYSCCSSFQCVYVILYIEQKHRIEKKCKYGKTT